MVVRRKAEDMSVNAAQSASPALTAADRCDHGACGAAARTRAVYPGGADLVFCRHHANEFRQALVSSGAELIEEPEPALTR